MLLALSLFVAFRGFFGSSIFVIVVLAGSFGFFIIWSLMICSSVMWSTCRGLRCFCGWNTICCRWLNSFLMIMLLKLKSEFVDVSIVVCSTLACCRFWSHVVKHSWFLAAENANLSTDSIFRKHVAQIFFGNKSSSSTWKEREIRKLHKNRFSRLRARVLVSGFFLHSLVILMLFSSHTSKQEERVYENRRRWRDRKACYAKANTMKHKTLLLISL